MFLITIHLKTRGQCLSHCVRISTGLWEELRMILLLVIFFLQNRACVCAMWTSSKKSKACQILKRKLTLINYLLCHMGYLI